MRILLPPSEAKKSGGRGRALAERKRRSPFDEVRDLVYAQLAHLLDTANDTDTDTDADTDTDTAVANGAAARALLLPPTAAEEALAANRRILSAATMPALQRYSGVVYEGLAQARLSEGARAAADRDVLIFSGLFGVLRGSDPIPAYRVPAKASLPGIGVLSTFWRRHLGRLMAPLLGPARREQGLVVDLRSSDYAAMWQPGRGDDSASRLLSVRVLSAKPDGTLGVISYNSKLAKGKLAAALLERRATGGSVESPDDVAEAWTSIGGKDALPRARTLGIGLDLID